MAAVARGSHGLAFGTMQWSAMDSTKRIPAKEARCWQSFDVLKDARITPAVKEEVRKKGFPAGLRADAYYVLSGAAALQGEHSGLYSALAASTANLSDDVIFQVEDDIRAARILHKESRLFATAKGAEVLSRLIFAYIQRGCSYWKGLASTVALLLTLFGREREESCFWTLVALLERRFYPHCGGQVPAGARVEVHVLQQLLEARQPAQAALLAKLGPEPMEALAGSWFSTAFSRTLPHEVVLRVWDCVVVEGPKVALRVALALVKMCASSIQSCTNLEVLCRVVEGRLSRHNDADALMAVAFKGLGSLSGSAVDAARARVQQQRGGRPGGHLPTAPMAAGAGCSGAGGSSALVRSSGSSDGTDAGGLSSGGGSSRAVSKQASPWPSPKGNMWPGLLA